MDVVHFEHPSSGFNRFDSSISPGAEERVISLWHRRETNHGSVTVPVMVADATQGEVYIVTYRFDSGTDAYQYDSGAGLHNWTVYLNVPTGQWNRIEQDIAADIERLTPGEEYHSVETIWIWGREFKLGEVRFSNAMTTTRNSLMPGSFGQIAYRETWSGTGGSPTPTYGGTARGGGERRWLSYNHIGNVVNTSHLEGEANDAGVLVELIDAADEEMVAQ